MENGRLKMGAVALSLFLALVLVLSACGGGGGSQSGAASEGSGEGGNDLIKLRVAYNKNGGQTPQYVAGTKGFFEKHGLSVERIEFKTNTDSVAALESGDLDIMASIPSNVWIAREAGFDIVAFMQNETAGTETPNSGALIVGAESGIKEPKDLAGKKIACLSLGSQDCLDMVYVLEKAGVPRDSYTIIESTFATHYDLLKNKQVDAVESVDPFTTLITKDGVGEVLFYSYIESNPDQPLGAWWAKREWVESNPEIVEKFSLAIKDAIDYLHEDEQRARDIVAEYTGLDPNIVKEMPMLKWNYELDIDAWQKEAEILVEVGGLKGVPDPKDYFAEAIHQYQVK